MGKFISILLGVYIFYYAANIVYDLFLKKEQKDTGNEEEEFSLNQVAEENKQEIIAVGIDDVEDLSRPTHQEEYSYEDNDLEDQVPDMNQLQRKFNDEHLIDSFDKTSNDEKEQKMDAKEQIKDIREKGKERFKKMMKMAETSVHIVDNIEGQKVYQSVIQF